MKNLLILFAAVFLMAAFSTRSFAQATSDQQDNNANAQVLSAIVLIVHDPLEFGGFTPGTGGTVVVATDGSRIQTLDVTLVTGTVNPTAASYTVTGTGRATYAITIPTAPFDITNTTGLIGETMAVTDMICSGGLAHTFSDDGNDAFTVGGTLNVADGQVPGVYTGTFPVTVAY